MLSEPRSVDKHNTTVKVWCPVCFKDREITTNGKCFVCGTKFVKPGHWQHTMKKLKLIIENDEMTPIEIRGYLYFINVDYIDKFKKINPTDYKQVGEFVTDIKQNCINFKVV